MRSEMEEQRPTPPRPAPHRRSPRPRAAALAVFALAAALVVATATGSAASVPPVGANPFAPAAQHAYRHGAVPTIDQQQAMRTWAASHPRATADPSALLHFQGGVAGIGVTTGHPEVYLVFWGSQWGAQGVDTNGDLSFGSDPIRAATLLQRLFRGLGTGGETWSGVMTQYCDEEVTNAIACLPQKPHVRYPTGGVLAGAWYDGGALAPAAATPHELGAEAIRAAGHFGNTSAAQNRDAQYVILSAPGLNPDNYRTGGFCAWHDWTGDPLIAATATFGDVAFTNLPYTLDAGRTCGTNYVNSGPAGVLDAYTLSAGHEYAETLTDQFPRGGWVDADGEENGDKCAWIPPGASGGAANVTTSTGAFALQSTWSNDSNGGSGGCENAAPAFPVQILTPGQVTVTVNRALTLQLQAAGGNPPYRWAVTGLPAGLSATAGGLISGSPAAVGSSSIGLTVTDADGAVASGGFPLTVADVVPQSFTGSATASKPGPAIQLATTRAYAKATSAGYTHAQCEVTGSTGPDLVGGSWTATVTVTCRR